VEGKVSNAKTHGRGSPRTGDANLASLAPQDHPTFLSALCLGAQFLNGFFRGPRFITLRSLVDPIVYCPASYLLPVSLSRVAGDDSRDRRAKNNSFCRNVIRFNLQLARWRFDGCVLFGAAFTLVVHLLRKLLVRKQHRRCVGEAYAAKTQGAISGSASIGIVLLPRSESSVVSFACRGMRCIAIGCG